VKPTKQTMLMNRWRYPSLSLHGIEGAFHGAGAKTVIPRKVSGKFSIRIVPDQTPEHLTECVQKYLKAEFAKLNSPNILKVQCIHGAKSWLGDPNDISFEAASVATQKVWGKVPDMTREGGSIPVTLDFTENTGKPACLLPLGASDDGAHSQNEKFDLKNLRNGIKTAALTLHQYAAMAATKSAAA
jgi:acetylornithine deacetylase/succinyl-diaminopimelate desuccinylase-like protein